MCEKPANHFLLLYASQTGQAQAIAEELFEKAEQCGLAPEMHCLSMTEKKFCLDKAKCAVIITSTTGEGEPPDTALKFWRRLKKRTLPSTHLENLNYSLLGLGDSNYSSFCFCGKNFHRRLQELGGKTFYPVDWADDAVGLEVAAEPWMEGVLNALPKQLGLTKQEEGLVCNGKTNLVNEKTELVNDKSELISGDMQKNPTKDTERTKDNDTQTSFDKESNMLGQNLQSETQFDTSNEVNNLKSKTTLEKGIERLNISSIESYENGHINGRTSEAVLQQSADTVIENDNYTTKNSDEPDLQSTNSHMKNNDNLKVVQETTSQNQVIQEVPYESGTVQEKPEPLIASLTQSVPPLCDSALTLPALPPAYLSVEFLPEHQLNSDESLVQNGCPFPSSTSDVTMVTVASATRLTTEDALKTALDIELDISGTDLKYRPGDSFGVVCPNNEQEVDRLIERLSLADKKDVPFSICVIPTTKKKNATVPAFIPNPCSVRQALIQCCDIRSAPKKAFLRMLVEHTSEQIEKRRLQELCSRQGGQDYTKYIRESSVTLYDILMAFPSCFPPWERLLEHLPRLQARPYSAASSQSSKPERLHFVFNIVEIPKGEGRQEERQGVCTGWLNTLTKQLQMKENAVDVLPKIPIHLRSNQHFHLPSNPSVPIVMIGPGTGVAPFIGFLQEREFLRSGGETLGPSWLVFGCRHKDRDYLYRSQLQHFVDRGILTKLLVSFSRDDQSGPRYVQDNIQSYSADVVELIDHQGAVVYVCGDAKNMAKNVTEAFVEILQKEKGLTVDDAKGYIMQMRLEKRYLEDVWT